ncbi:hypothetical protein HBA54_05215 [Pelagibius litoralis]|uniref:Uncharacterized protein n=1 Tax=Pelagibius litoralis TaxID=374515 RepID=A0A967EX68_9PROT|nr:hypothetical protein [Pelagibius litoralis]NIA67985.1 hypothetical protein [Pelagibius litoralis]
MTSQHPSPSGPPTGAVADLPVAATVVASFASVFGQIGLVAQAAKGAFVMLLAASLISLALPNSGLVNFFMILVSLAATSHFGVNWCRVMLLGPQGLPTRSLGWGDVHWRFFGNGLMIFVIMIVMMLPLTVIGSFLAAILGLVRAPDQVGPGIALVFLLVFLGILYVLARLGFVFPAVAAEEGYGLGLSWKHTAGQGFRITAALFAAGLPIAVAQLMLTVFLIQTLFGISIAELMPQLPAPGESFPPEPAPGSSPAEAPSAIAVIIFNLISAAANFLSFAVLFSLLCIAFRTCTGWVPPQGSVPMAVPPREDDD